MNIISRGTLIYYTQKYPNAKNQLLTWYNEFSKYDFENLNQLKEVYKSASIVNSQRIVFNIKGNDFRLIISINFRRKACYTIWFGTHIEYDKINAETIEYNENL
jgi:mRNA interferase HigB